MKSTIISSGLPIHKPRAGLLPSSPIVWSVSHAWGTVEFRGTPCELVCACRYMALQYYFRVSDAETIIVRVVHSARDVTRLQFDEIGTS
jgi:hypothetical protein